jgi:hypothetical protein
LKLLGVKKSNAERELALIEGHLGAQYPKCRSCFRVGTPFEQTVQEAENIGANLIVMSCHSYGCRTGFSMAPMRKECSVAPHVLS